MRQIHKAIFLVILCTLFTSSGQIFWKLGLGKINFNNVVSVINLPFVLGFVAYGIGLMLMLMAFKKGELSVLYPIIATSYVWVSLFSPIIFPTDFMNFWKWVGVVVILVSVSILGFSGTSKKKVVSYA